MLSRFMDKQFGFAVMRVTPIYLSSLGDQLWSFR
jgi:hypothetical protein